MTDNRHSTATVLELLDYSGLEDRVRDLEAMLRQYRDLAQLGIEELHKANVREQRLRETIRQQIDIIRELRRSLLVTNSENERRAA